MHTPVIWRPAPFIRILALFIPGIMLQYYFRLSINVILIVLIPLLCLSLFNCALKTTASYLNFKFQGTHIYLSSLFAGMLVTCYNEPQNHKHWYGNKTEASRYLEIQITEPGVLKKKSVQYFAIVEKIDGEKSHGKLTIYIDKTSKKLPGLNDKLLIKNKLTTFPVSGTPGSFDYGKYMQMKGIHHSAWLTDNDFTIIGKSKNILRSWLYDCKDHILQTLNRFFKNKEVIGIAEALLIGYKENIDNDLKQAYTHTGVIHVIAISGLHLGLIYVVLVYLLKKIPWIWRKVILRAVIVLGALWIFSLLTGAPASVLRSAVMFSCMHIGESFFRKSSVYNTMAASAFLLLCWQPYFIWDPGFTLSYLAVLGIVILQKPIERLIFIKSKLLRAVWSMTSVTIAAQIATLPLCIYYFHQFPNLFLITNLVVVPLSTVILFAEIMLIAFSWITGIEHFATLVQWMIEFMNWFIIKMDTIPFAITAPIFSNEISSWLLGGTLAFTSRFFVLKSKRALRISLIFLLLLSVNSAIQQINTTLNRKLIVYNYTQSTNLDIIFQNKILHIGDSLPSNLLYEYHLKPARIHFRAKKEVNELKQVKLDSLGLILGTKKWIHLRSSSNLIMKDTIKADVLLVSGNAPVPTKHLHNLKVDLVVLDATNSLWKIEQWKKACEELLLRCHSVTQEGTFVYSW